MVHVMNRYSRRQVIKQIAGLAGTLAMGGWGHFWPDLTGSEFRIGACDWSIGKRGDIGAFQLAKKIGLDGLQISLARDEQDVHLLDKKVRRAFKEESHSQNVQIGGLALGILNNVPYKSDPRAERWVAQSIDVAADLGCEVVLLAFFGKGDIKGDDEGIREVISRLKKVAPRAEEQGITLGIESWLSAKEHMQIIEAVGSDSVNVYYDVANSNKMGYDIYNEIRWLGDEQICEFHAKENGTLLGEGRVDFERLRKVIDEIGYKGWIQIEGAVPEGKEIYQSYLSNIRLMRRLFS